MRQFLKVSTALVFIASQPVFASGSTVTCTLDNAGKKESIQLKLDANGKIVQWDNTKWAVTSKGAETLAVFSENIEEYGFEWSKSFRAPNGYSILELGTTADASRVGVNLKTKTGFYTYLDQGSGSGNEGPLKMVCR